jgi:hypothetical protein
VTSILLEPEARGVDGVGLSTLRDFSKVVDAGYQWVSLYLGGMYGVHGYAIEAAWAAGLPVMLNYERGPADATNGYGAGQRAALAAISQARALGFEGEAPIIFSAADEHFAPAAGLDYHQALVDVFGPVAWTGGGYGFREMLALLSQQDWWPDDWPLWHWGGDGSTIYPWTWVKQGPGGSYYDATIGMQVDRNTLYKPMRFWSGYGPDDRIDPPAVEVDMPTLFKSNDAIHWPGSPTLPAGDYPPNNGHVFLVEVGGAVRHITSSEFTVYLSLPTPTPVAVVAGLTLKGLLDDFGVYKPPSTATGDCATTADVKALLDAVTLTIDYTFP